MDASDQPLSVEVGWSDEVYLGMAADLTGNGGIARMSPACVPVTHWRSGRVLDLGFDTSAQFAVWALEAVRDDAGAGGEGRRVARYSATGALLGEWPVDASARYLAMDFRSGEIFIAFLPTESEPARVAVYSDEGLQLRSWALPGEPRGLAISRSLSEDRPVYVLLSEGDWDSRLIRFEPTGAPRWEVPLELDAIALARAGGQAILVGRDPTAVDADASYLRINEDAELVRSWPIRGIVPRDLSSGSSEHWMLGHAPDAPETTLLLRFDAFGTMELRCNRFPQPSESTPEPPTSCPQPIPGAIAWRYAAAGTAEGAPAVAADGSIYLATLDGLMHAVDCAGGRSWIFDYREQSPTGFGAQAFHSSPAVDEEGTIYIGDDVVVPNFFFAVHPDGQVKWVERYESTYSQIDTSAALSPDGRIYAAAHGWGAGVDHGAILVLHRDGRRLRPPAGSWGTDAGPITDSPVVLGDASAAYLSPTYQEWVLPTGTPATATPTTPTATRSPASPTPSPSTTPLPWQIQLPWLALDVEGRTLGDSGISDPLDQPMPPPWVTQPVPARLRVVRPDDSPDVVVDLPGYREPSSPAADGQDIWFTVEADDGAHLLAYRKEGASLQARVDVPVPARVEASPLLGRLDPSGSWLEVLLMGIDGRLVALEVDPETGSSSERWSQNIGLPAPGAPALGDDGRVYAAGGDTAVAVDRESGELVWSIALDSPVSGSLTLSPDGMLYVPTQSGVLHAIGTASGGLDPESAWPAFRHDARNSGASP